MDNATEAPIEKAVRLVGGQSALAKTLGVSPQAVQQWVKSGQTPANRCRAIESATNGAVTRCELNPEVFGDAFDQSSQKMTA